MLEWVKGKLGTSLQLAQNQGGQGGKNAPTVLPKETRKNETDDGSSDDESVKKEDQNSFMWKQISVGRHHYELFYELPPGSCANLQVQRSSTGTRGWLDAALGQQNRQWQNTAIEEGSELTEKAKHRTQMRPPH